MMIAAFVPCTAHLQELSAFRCCLCRRNRRHRPKHRRSYKSAAPHGIAVANIDPSVKPGDDFYRYANGGWIARTEIPADRAGIGVFSILADRSSKNVAAIIEEAAKSNAPAGSNARKIADLYNASMDETAIEARGMKPLEPHLAAIAAIHDRHDLALALGKTLRADVDLLNNAVFSTSNLFGLWVAPGFSDSDHYMPYLLQGGLEMPSRDYYLDDSEHMKDVRAKYATHVAAMLRLAGLDDPDGSCRTRHRARARHRRNPHQPRRYRRHRQGQQPLDSAPTSPPKRRPRLGRVLRSRRPRSTAAVHGLDAHRADRRIGAGRLHAHRYLERLARLPSHRELRRRSAHAPSPRSSFPSSVKVLTGVQQQRPRWQLGVGLVNA